MYLKKTLPIVALSIVIYCVTCRHTLSGKSIELAAPDKQGGITLLDALNRRSSSRSFSETELSGRVLSNLLWAAYGINRIDTGKRTAPSSMNRQEIEVYVVMKSGAYIYNAKKHRLDLVSVSDLRELTGKQPFVKTAPVNLVYVADMDKVAGGSGEEKLIYAAADTGFIGENVYLFCASEGLSTVIRAFIDKGNLGKALNLKGNKRIILSQTVGYPAK